RAGALHTTRPCRIQPRPVDESPTRRFLSFHRLWGNTMHVLPSRTALAAALAIALGASAPATSATHTVTAAQPSVAAIDAARSDPHQLILQAGAFDPAAQVLDVSSVGAGSATLSSYAIVQFQPGHLDERKALVARGVQFLGYIPNNAYYVRLNGLGLSELAHNPAIRWAGVV